MTAEFTKVSRTLFRRSKKFRSLNDEARLLYLYLLVNEHINSSGCYDLSRGYALTDLGWSEKQFSNSMETVCKASLIGWDTSGDTILIEGWMTFNEPANARHAMGIVSQLSEIDSTPLKRKRFDEVMDCIAKKKLFNERGAGGELHTLCKRFQDRLLTVSPPETETETGDGEGYGEGDREGDLDLKSRARARDAAATLTGAALAIVKPDPTQEPPNPSPLLQTNYLKRAKLKGGNDL